MTIDLTTPCVPWSGWINAEGYGKRTPRKRGESQLAHRFVYEQRHGPIPDGLVIDHLCRNRACINTQHMEVVTHRENVMRGIGPTAVNAAKMTCKHGHRLTPDNVYEYRGRRCCRECHRRRSLAYAHKTRAAA